MWEGAASGQGGRRDDDEGAVAPDAGMGQAGAVRGFFFGGVRVESGARVPLAGFSLVRAPARGYRATLR